MNIRDDRGRGVTGKSPPAVPTKSYLEKHKDEFFVDAVLVDCGKCGRSHFVTVDQCPDHRTAARETALASRQTAAA